MPPSELRRLQDWDQAYPPLTEPPVPPPRQRGPDKVRRSKRRAYLAIKFKNGETRLLKTTTAAARRVLASLGTTEPLVTIENDAGQTQKLAKSDLFEIKTGGWSNMPEVAQRLIAYRRQHGLA